MITIHTGRLRDQAELLNKEAFQYNHRLSGLEDCIVWLRHQEFDEVDEILWLLSGQREKLDRQKEELLMLSGILQRICSRYETAEQEILESTDSCQKLKGYVKTIKLSDIRDRLAVLGVQITL